MHFDLLLLAIYATSIVSVVRAAGTVPGKVFDRFVTIWLENEDFTSVTENADFHALAMQGILLTSYFAVTHPSQPNYVASVGGDYFGLDSDNDVEIPANVSTLVDLFDAKGISWKEYLESIPSPGYTGTSTTNGSGHTSYVRKHNPLVSFASVSNNQSRSQNIVSLDEFQKDLAAQSLPQWMHISPNMSNDGHDTGLAYGLAWSRNFLTPLLSNTNFTDRTLILLTLDESATYSKPNQVASLLLGDIPTNLKGSSDDTFYTHYSFLATLENNFGLPSLGRYDVGASVFQAVANGTGYRNQNIVDKASVHLNESYPGYLSSHNNLSIPTPNINLVGAGGQGVLASIISDSCMNFSTPYNGSGEVFDSMMPPVYASVDAGSKVNGSSKSCTSSSQVSSHSAGVSLHGRSYSTPIIAVALVLLLVLV